MEKTTLLAPVMRLDRASTALGTNGGSEMGFGSKRGD